MPAEVRAGKACNHCHRRRVKCDGWHEGLPCTSCRQRHLKDCSFLKTKRGTYDRTTRGLTKRSSAHITEVDVQQTPQNENAQADDATTPLEGPRQTPQEVIPPARCASEDREAPLGHFTRDAPDPSGTSSPRGTLNDNNNGGSLNEGEAWALAVEHLVESRPASSKLLDKSSITYVGETFPLAVLMSDCHEGEQFRVHHRVPQEVGAEQDPKSLQLDEFAFLRARGAFKRPPDDVLDRHITTFLDVVFPFYPIVNARDLLHQYRNKSIPWLLLHSICFIAATYGPFKDILAAGFKDRMQARLFYYKKAEALFGMGFEKNKVTIMQSAILLSFRLGGPDGYYNYYTWLNAAISIAELLGVHRSITRTRMTPQDKRLFKRIWWVLVTRDTFNAAVLGRTMRIDLTQCDMEMLDMHDLDLDGDINSDRSSNVVPIWFQYQIHVAEFSLLLRDCAQQRLAVPPRFHGLPGEASWEDKLTKWREAIPSELQWSPYSSSPPDQFAAALSIYHDHLLIFLSLNHPNMRGSSTAEQEQRHPQPTQSSDVHRAHLSEPSAQIAAQRITTLASGLVTANIVLTMPHEIFIGIFSAGVALLAQLVADQHSSRSSFSPTDRWLATRAQLSACQVALHAVRDFWDSACWVTRLWDKILASIMMGRDGNQKRLPNESCQQPSFRPEDFAPMRASSDRMGPDWRLRDGGFDSVASDGFSIVDPGPSGPPRTPATCGVPYGDDTEVLLTDAWMPGQDFIYETWFNNDIFNNTILDSDVFEANGTTWGL